MFVQKGKKHAYLLLVDKNPWKIKNFCSFGSQEE